MLNKSLLTALAVLAVSQSYGQAISSLTPNGANTFNNGVGYTLGWTFTVGPNALVVTALGYFDDNGDGLSERHDVGIFDTAANLQLSTNVSTGDPLLGLFRYNSSMSGNALLLANTTYVIGGGSGVVDAYTFNPNAITVDPAITYVNSNFNQDGGFTLTFPGTASGEVGFFGPNFTFQTVPEPFSMLALGTGILALARKRRKN